MFSIVILCRTIDFSYVINYCFSTTAVGIFRIALNLNNYNVYNSTCCSTQVYKKNRSLFKFYVRLWFIFEYSLFQKHSCNAVSLELLHKKKLSVLDFSIQLSRSFKINSKLILLFKNIWKTGNRQTFFKVFHEVEI